MIIGAVGFATATLAGNVSRESSVPARKPETKTTAAADRDAPLFEKDVLPVLKAKCVRCHNAKARKADLDLTSFAGVMNGGESGKVVDTKKPEKSPLVEMIHEGYMPPDGKKPVTEAELKRISRWIAGGARAANAAQSEIQLTQHDVLPILLTRCTVCHGPRIQEAGLDLRSKAAMLKGGKSGPAIVPGHPKKSLLLKRIHAEEMPPRKKLVRFGVRPVQPAELETLTKWIAQGAPEVDVSPDVATTKPDPLVTDEDRQFWAFQSPERPSVPTVKQQHLVRNAVDAFLLRKLEANGLSFSEPADRYTLIRRVAFDLTGLPPKWEDVQRFVNDTSPRAYERMVEKYLASPRYGERWGQYWLDLAGYSDSEGKRSADVVRPNAWRYRDYVIRAFNANKPYDRFLLEQIAGDELPESHRDGKQRYENLVATGFLRMAPDGTGSDIVNTVVERMEVVADEIDVLGGGVMGLTIKCAKCHSHKYDPIPQRDYYRLVAVFQGAYDVHDWLRGTTVRGQTKELAGFRTLEMKNSPEFKQWQETRDELLAQIAAEKDRLKKLRQELSGDKLRKQVAASNRKVRKLQRKMPPKPGIRALWDRGQPSPTYVFRRGDPTNPGKLVGPGVPSVLTDGKTPFDVKPPWPRAGKTGRRLAFAKWLTQPDHPLTARVMVNRIWYHHFGRGIVTTLGNFGRTGARPTHPELLDWLATEFVQNKWSIKHMHRVMLFSTAYRQSSGIADSGKTQTNNPQSTELFGRMPLRRMEAEVVRDGILAVAGELNLTPFGKPDPVDARSDGLVTSKPGKSGWRRSIYVQHRRTQMPTILENFDRPQMIPNCITRPTSTVSSQALHLMNNQMIRDLAEKFALRIEGETQAHGQRPVGPARKIERIYQIALSRPPTDEERNLGVETLQKLTVAWSNALKTADKDEPAHRALSNVCHTIINSAAFLYVD